TFREHSARCPNRASTVRAHNWVVSGALLPMPGQPALFLPTAGRLYFRKTQLPAAQNGPPVCFRTKCELLVEMARQHANACPGKTREASEGASAGGAGGRRRVRRGQRGLPRIAFLPRLRRDARLSRLPRGQRRPGQRGPPRVGGKQLPPPRQGG